MSFFSSEFQQEKRVYIAKLFGVASLAVSFSKFFLPEKMETPQVRRGHQNRELDPEEKLGK
jgi:hypothetical protein